MGVRPPYPIHRRETQRAVFVCQSHFPDIDMHYIIALLIIIFSLLFSTRGTGQIVAADSSANNSDTLKKAETRGPFDVPHDSLTSISAYDSTQSDTTVKLVKKYKHSPLKAGLFSAIIPGLGQAYNKKYWKIPIVYAGFGGLGFAMYYTATNFHGFRAAYRQQVALVPDPYASYQGVTDAATLKVYRDYYKKYVDISAIGLTVWYMLTIIDATVDAHLMDWNMKDDLSVSWHPVITPGTDWTTASLSISFTLGF
jgi:hypothetical protein